MSFNNVPKKKKKIFSLRKTEVDKLMLDAYLDLANGLLASFLL